ncbi:NAD(P)H-dependent oxidoreductase [Sporolactobacillus sp. CQH2019]|uniref:NADPH-dependent FMN reductase n=1 Tax=Sporolactobacillus sp. CQH2019 TaxID=3023512 RepID=UPI00236831D0|nr:NAD(P)H-dependent oxidoreductase [Sporolactobacillus sp. CQH2019]MDD9150232.1 NAD(P)H-dependent oxidoreductase [Sporolactobacillus sp. CQH2019]
MAGKNIGVLVGSLRKDSYNRLVAKTLAPLFPKDYHVNFIKLDDLSFYNQDFDDENRVPESWQTFRKTLQSIDAVLFVTPEYNRSVPAVLKNALDVGSRPYGQSVWDKKPAAIVSVSIGGISGFGANHHLRQSLTFLNMPTLQQPEAYIGHVASLIDENGKITNENTLKFFQTIVDAFVELIRRYN